MTTKKEGNEEQMLQQLSAQANKFQEYIEKLERSLFEIQNLKISVEDISKLKKGDKINAPLANGIFIPALIDDSKHLFVNVGEGVVLKKTIPQTIKLLEKQEKEIRKAKEDVEAQVEDFYSTFR